MMDLLLFFYCFSLGEILYFVCWFNGRGENYGNWIGFVMRL